jgi:hypothetical protein
MTTASETNSSGSEANLALVAGQLLGAMPSRVPQRLSNPTGCGWCGDDDDNAAGESNAHLHKQDDPAAWMLHVLREHVRNLLGPARASVDFNPSGGATLRLHDAFPEDVALIRETLGIQLSCVTQFDVHGRETCAVNFGRNPYGREVTMTWYTSTQFLQLAAELATSGWPFGPVI